MPQIKEKITETIINNKSKISVLAIGIVYIILATMYFKKDPYNLATKHKNLSIFTTLFGMSILFVIMYFVSKKESARSLFSTYQAPNPDGTGVPIKIRIYQFIFSVLLFVVAISLIVGIIYLLKNLPVISSIVIYSLNILIVISAIAFLYKLLPQFKKPKSPWIMLIYDIAMFLPCLITDFVDYLKQQYSITTRTTWIILGLEIVLIALRILIPKLLGYIIKHDSVELSDGAIKLSNRTSLGSYESIHKTKQTAGTNHNYNYNYAISFWFYIDPQPDSMNPSYTKNTNILSYGGKPKISYNAKNNELIVTALTGKEEVVVYRQTKVPYQKWTNVIFNYEGGTLDIFMNDKLISSTPGIVPYMEYDNITVGEVGGIYGLVSNVLYFKTALTRNKITWAYNSSYKL